MSYDDLPLGTAPPPERAPERPSSLTRMVIVGALGIAVGALLMLWWMGRSQPAPATPAAIAATDVVSGSNRPKQQPMSLPSLDGSDGLLRDLVGVLSRHPLMARLLATNGLVRAAVLSVVQIGEGRTPATSLEVLRPSSRVSILGTDTGRVDAASYARWDDAVAALTSIDPAELAQLYVNVKDLFDDAYEEHGHPTPNFDEAIVSAITMLASTPSLTEDPVLLKRPDYYIHEDPALRILPPVQKQFLLLGPANQQAVLAWLRRLGTALDLPLPPDGR